MDSEPDILETAASLDGTKRWHLLRRDDGFFVYDEDSFFSEDLSDFGGGLMEYWTPTHFSGIFDTPEAARRDALGQIAWLREVLPSK
ncbi:MAG TPA: hypothetical protein VF631_09555 [Allosphingosinicella sp.]|uniref:hypothetical protein n=1 Tax=Allosphingosinicella sp. TaxID=2823234 RepID=UPI002F29D92E